MKRLIAGILVIVLIRFCTPCLAEDNLLKRVARDFKHIGTSPQRMDGKWLAVGSVLGITGLLIACDDELLEKVKCEESGEDFVYYTKHYLGDARYTVPVLLGLYMVGSSVGSEREKETALRGLEALAVAGLIEISIQVITGRERPEQGGRFKWFESGHFPAGDTTMAFALAPIFDRQYCKIDKGDSGSEKFLKYLGKGIVYGLPSAVAYHRLKTGSHYPSDVFASIVLALSVGNMVNKLNDEKRDFSIEPLVSTEYAGLVFKKRF